MTIMDPLQIKMGSLMLLTICACCTNVISLELMIREYSASHNLITCVQFLFITVCAFDTSHFKSKVPIKNYLNLVLLFFVVTLAGNYALGFNIPMPLHMIFKSGSLMANMILSMITFRRRYRLIKYLSVFTITFGIIVCTIASSKNIKSNTIEEADDASVWFNWIIGISLLTFSVFGSAQTGIMQEKMTAQYGRHSSESLFFSHALPLPGFLLLYPSILAAVHTFNQSSSINLAQYPYIPFLGQVPRLWLFLLLNMLTQFACAKSIFVLSEHCTSLTITLLITLRKFFSLVISIYLFRNPFTVAHWLGTLMVFAGTLLFTEPQLPARLRFWNKIVLPHAEHQKIKNN